MFVLCFYLTANDHEVFVEGHSIGQVSDTLLENVEGRFCALID